jgi:WD40 repeat protein
MHPDISLLNNLNLKPNDFDILLDIIDLIGYNDDTISILNKYVPNDYDLSLFPKKLLKQMLKLSKMDAVIVFSYDNHKTSNDINILDHKNGQKIATLKLESYLNESDPIYYVRICENNNQIAFRSKNCLRIYDLTTMKQINRINFNDEDFHIRTIIYSPDGQYIAFSYGSKIDVRKIIDHDLICWKLLEHQPLCYVADISYDNTYVISLSFDSICIFNINLNTQKRIMLAANLCYHNMLCCQYYIDQSVLKKNLNLLYLENNHILMYNMDGTLINKINVGVIILVCSM